ncbi:MAG: hypothetical protein AAFY56_05875 [Pseudomonadota bacterium]
MWQGARRYLDDIDPDRLHLRIGIIVCMGVTLALSILYATPLWPNQLMWAALMPVFAGVIFMARPPNSWPQQLLMAGIPFAAAIAVGSYSEPGTSVYVPMTAGVGFVCGLGIGFGPVWATTGILSFIAYAAAGGAPGGVEALPERWSAMALGVASVLVFARMIRWPRADPLTIARRRLYNRLARLLDGDAHRQALTVQPLTYALWQALARIDSDEADEAIRRQVLLRNAVVLLSEVEVRAITAGVSPKRLLMSAAARRAAQSVLRAMARQEDARSLLTTLDAAVQRAVSIIRQNDPATVSLERQLRRSELIYSLQAIKEAIHAEIEAIETACRSPGHRS